MWRRTLIFILLTFISAFSACRTDTAAIDNQAVPPVPTTSPASKTAAPVPQNKNYDGRGVVTRIDLKQGSVELDHEKIEGLMSAMTMEFYVADRSGLEKLKVGDKVDFVVEYKEGQEKIVSIKKAT